jgi:hypothetical protein
MCLPLMLLMLLMLLGMKVAPSQLKLFHAAGSAVDVRQLCGAFRSFSLLTCGATVGSTGCTLERLLSNTHSDPHRTNHSMTWSTLASMYTSVYTL